MEKKITHITDLSQHIQTGVDKIATIVARTLGPGGLPILIQRVGQALDGSPLPPMITKDGVTVAMECSDPDPNTDVIIQAVKAICQKTNRVAGDGPQPLYSKVLTPRGFVDMKDVEVGMDICGTNGTTQKVLGVYPKGQKEIYKIVTSDDREVECSPDHLWEVTSSWGIKEIKTSEQISQDFIKTDVTENDRYKYYLPITNVDFLEIKEEMPLDPYLVGVLLGDGCFSDSGSIELSLGLKKKHIIDKLILPEGVTKTIQLLEKSNSYRVKLKGIRHLVNSLGLGNTDSNTKFIPKSYLYASTRTRECLLQGLLDTDGYINDRGLFEYSTVSDELANDFLTLVRSLGKSTYYRFHTREKDTNSYSDTPIHRITELKGYKYGTKIVNVAKTGKLTEMQCIKVSNDDHLYITDNFIPTHNTTTAIVLGQAILEKATEIVQSKKINPQELRLQIEESAKIVDKMLTEMATPCKELIEIENIATISANGDKEIGKIIREAFDAVGDEGVITVDEGSGKANSIDIVDGMQVKRGAEAQDRFFNNDVATKFEGEDALVVIYDGKMQQPVQVMSILEKILTHVSDGKNTPKLPPIVFIANEFSMDVIQFLLINKIERGLSFCALRGPNTTKIRTAMYDDIATFLGGTRLGNGNRNLDNLEIDDLGLCDRVVIDKYNTTLFGGAGLEEDVIKRVDQLKSQRAVAESEYDAASLSGRIGALSEGVAKIGVGGTTELEIKEKYHRIEDAVNAARAAIEQGVVVGGGMALFKIADKIAPDNYGSIVLREALRAPLVQILENLGKGKELTNIIKLSRNEDIVYDGCTGEIVKAKDSGIVDPVKVTRVALENAVSIAALLTTCGGAIVFEKPKG
ncbi:MAG: hypothetical protein DRN81_02970 [Thermoproteota archaeon]|nr:MAG: hypothetical protein DRN81_02970 [Candidatus Korarchaeota archaeon]